MPRPPTLPTIDWPAVFESGKTFEDWLASAEKPDNAERMKKVCHLLDVPPYLEAMMKALDRDVHVVAIAEDWCGDVVRHVPMLQRLVLDAPRVRIRYISREQHPDVFARYLTNGGEAIPKFVFFNDEFVECGNWGPMPDMCREIIARGKACGDMSGARKKVSAIYEMDDGGRMVFEELTRLIQIAVSVQP